MIKVNLIPDELKRRAPGGFSYFYFFAIPVIVSLVLVPIYTSKNQELKKITEEVEIITKEIDKHKNVQEELNKVNSDINLIKSKISFIQDKKRRQAFWNKTLDKITAILPQNVWLDNLSLSADGNISFSANTFSFNDIADFIKILNKSPNFYNVKLYSTLKSHGGVQGTDRVAFSMSLNYRELDEKK